VNTEKKSFWSSLPGMVTGIAGVVGAIVGVISVLIALGVIGGSKSSPTVTTVPSSDTPGATSPAGGKDTRGAAGQGSFTVDPSSLTLSLAKPKASVTVINDGSVPLKISAPIVSGSDQDKFTVYATGCTSAPLVANKSCSMDVTFAGGLSAKATLTVTADKADKSTVALTGSL